MPQVSLTMKRIAYFLHRWKLEGKGPEIKNEGYEGYGKGRGKEEEHRRVMRERDDVSTFSAHRRYRNYTPSYN